MFADISPAWGLGQSAITALAGLGGVCVGAWMTARNQKAERKNARIRLQLETFYSPLLGMRLEIKAKGELRVRISDAAGAEWPEKFKGFRNPDTLQRISERESPKYDRLLEYNNKQLRDQILPLYRKMLEYFSSHLWLANPSTLPYYANLVNFVEVWNRHIEDSIPPELISRIDHREEDLFPFYEDLQRQFDKLSAELRS